ncbi:hypothetical protein [Actinoplanes sp. NPDC026619]
MRLRRLVASAEDYRKVRAHLCGGPASPARRLSVDLSVPYRPVLGWQ